MKKLQLMFLGSLLLSSCTMTGGGGNAFVWPDAWTSAKPGEAKRGGEYRSVYYDVYSDFNPFTSNYNGAGDLLYGTGLLRYDPATRAFIPYMAVDMPQVSADGRVYTVKLRPGMKFSDGTPITAQDFVVPWQIMVDPEVKSPYRGDYFMGGEAISLKALDDLTLQVTFPKATITAENFLRSQTPWPAHIFGKAYQSGGAKSVAALWSKNPQPGEIVTAGMLTPSAVNPGEVVFAKNKYWGEWNRDSQGQALPYLNSVRVKTIPQTARPFDRFLAGEVDTGQATNARDITALREAIGSGKLKATLKTDIGPRNSQSFLIFNWNKAGDPFKQALFRDVRFRQAISHLYNRQKVIEQTLGGVGTPAYAPIPALHRDFLPAGLPQYPFDPAAAAKLLAELGFTQKDAEGYLVRDGKRLEFDLTSFTDPQTKAEMEIVVADAKAAGVKINFLALDGKEFAALLGGGPDKKVLDRPFDAIRLAQGGYSEVWPFLAAELVCAQASSVHNRSGECFSPQEQRLSELFLQGQSELSRDKRLELGQALNRLSAEQLIDIPLVAYGGAFAYDSRLGGEYPAGVMNSLNGQRALALTFIK